MTSEDLKTFVQVLSMNDKHVYTQTRIHNKHTHTDTQIRTYIKEVLQTFIIVKSGT